MKGHKRGHQDLPQASDGDDEQLIHSHSRRYEVKHGVFK